MSSSSPDAALVSSVSHTAEDREWDDFLLSTPAGSFSQTGMWAQVKESEGWKPLRLVVRNDAEIVAGVQILWKTKCGLRMAYVVKGPVLKEDAADLAADAVSRMVRLAVEERIAFLIVQPPDIGVHIPRSLSPQPFLPNHVISVISANLVVDLSPGWDALEKQMRRTTRQEAHQALRHGLAIREGGASDLPLFHQLMKHACRRLGAAPNPRTVSSLETMWRTFNARGSIRLTLAEYDGQTVAGLLSVVFGRAVTFWKKGSINEARSCHADVALFHEGVAWACRNGCLTCDFAAMTRSTAEALICGLPLPDKAMSTRDFLHLGFGGRPVLLPESGVLVPNPALRAGYRLVTAFPQGRRLLKQVVGVA